MAATLVRTSARAALRSGASATPRAAGVAGLTFARGKATLPDLKWPILRLCLWIGPRDVDAPTLGLTLGSFTSVNDEGQKLIPTDDYGALEPSISGQIMEVHHKAHHQTYVNNYNASVEQLQEAQAQGNIAAQIALKPAINFNGGGHLNHSLFWENLAPKNAGGGEPPSGALSTAINNTYGSLDEFKNKMNAALAGIQGSGWAWLVKDNGTGQIGIRAYADPVVGQFKPLLGIDAWEHAYYLQYQNRKAEYFKAIWEVINWKAVEQRFS